jgi:hypothetical protein
MPEEWMKRKRKGGDGRGRRMLTEMKFCNGIRGEVLNPLGYNAL